MCGGNKGQSNTTQSQTQSYTPNPAAAGAITGALGQAYNASQTPFQAPVAPVAGFSQDQQNAFRTVNNAQGMAQPYINQAAQDFSPQGTQQFLNPYTQNVMANLQDIFGQQNSQNTGQLTQAAGGVGADRIAVGQSELAKQQGLSAGQTFANLYGQAAQQAQSAGYGTAALGSQAQNAALSGAQAQLGTGGLQQQLSQAQLNAPYQNTLAQLAYPFQTSNFYSGAVGALAPGLGGTTSGYGNGTAQAAPPNMFSQLAGAGIAGAGLYNGLSNGKGSAAYGGGSAAGGDAHGGSAGSPLPGLTMQDYGSGYGRGGDVGYDEGGVAEEDPYRLPASDKTAPIDIEPGSVVPATPLRPMQPHIPQVNLNPPQQQQQSGSSPGLGDMAKLGLSLATIFAKRGGAIRGYADGGSELPDVGEPAIGDGGEFSPGTGLGNKAADIATRMIANTAHGAATLPRRAIENSQFSLDTGNYDPSVPMEAAMALTGGAGAVPAEANTLRAGLKFPEGYYDKIPIETRTSRVGVSHPGIRWEVYDPKSGTVMRKDIASRSGATLAQDRLDNKYGGYKYQVRPVRAKTLTETESQFLKDKNISFDEPSGGMASGGAIKSPYYADGGAPTFDDRFDAAFPARNRDDNPYDVVNPGEPLQDVSPEAMDNWRKGVDTAKSVTDPMSFAPTGGGTSSLPHAVAAGASGPSASPYGGNEMNAPPGASQDLVAPDVATTNGLAKSPWTALVAAGLGMMGGTSPYFGVNVGKGGMEGVKMLEQQRLASQKDTTIEQAAKRLAQEAKFHEDAMKNAHLPYEQMTMAQKEAARYDERKLAMEEMKPVNVGTDLYGHPIMAKRDPNGDYINIVTGKKVEDPNQTTPTFNIPGARPGDEATLPPHARVTDGVDVPAGVNPEVLARYPAGFAKTLRAIDEGRENLTSIPYRNRQAYIDALHEYDGNWDQTVYKLRQDQQADLSTKGTAGKMITAVNQLLPHLKTASDKAQELENSDFPAANTIRNFWLTATGDPRVKKFQTVREVASMDAARLLRGTGQMAEADIEHWRKTLAESGSPRQLQETLGLLGDDLIGARISSIEHSYRTNMRMKPPDFVSPEAKEALAAIRVRATPPEQRGASAAPAVAPQDKQALDWANANPGDPRAAAIKQRLGVQ